MGVFWQVLAHLNTPNTCSHQLLWLALLCLRQPSTDSRKCLKRVSEGLVSIVYHGKCLVPRAGTSLVVAKVVAMAGLVGMAENVSLDVDWLLLDVAWKNFVMGVGLELGFRLWSNLCCLCHLQALLRFQGDITGGGM